MTVLQAGVAEEVGLDSARIERARELIHEQVDSGRSPGISAVVARRGRIVLQEAVGARTPSGDPMLADSVFPIASATKPITAAVVMSLVEEGRIGLLQGVRDYIPELPPEVGEGVLIHHLLTHTGGFDSPVWTGKLRTRMLHHGEEDLVWGRDRFVNAFLGCMAGLERRKPPGAGMLYANISYELLGEIARRVSGTSLGELMLSRIFHPLGMASTAMTPDDALRARMVERNPAGPMGTDYLTAMFGCDMETMLPSDSAGAGVVSTALDNVRFGQMVLNGGTFNGQRVLSKASVDAMTTNQIPAVPDVLFGHAEASWGYGFSVICHERWPYFGGGLVPPGSVTHTGAGGIDHWIDFDNEIVGAYFEIVTEMSDMMEPISSAGHRFQDVITSAVID
ncbi:MAG: serine hydrolase domain-containing protein [Acidimicrobiales bacterium]